MRSSVIIVQASLAAASAILSEASMSFLGVGVQAPQASWGAMLKAGYNYLSMAPWMSVFPGVAIVLAVLALNFVGDGLRMFWDLHHLLQEWCREYAADSGSGNIHFPFRGV